MAIVTPHTDADGLDPSHEPSALADEMRAQLELARRRAAEREHEREETEAKLRRPDGLLEANDPLRVAKRLDRVTRFLAGGDPMDSPSDAPAEALVESAMDRAVQMAPPPEPAPVPTAARRAAPTEGIESLPSGGAEPEEHPDGEHVAPVPVAPKTLLERIINTADFVSVRYLDAGVLAQHAVGRVNIRDARGTLRGYGTGFLVSPALLLTNHHVLPDPETARTSIIEFNYQDGVDGRPLLPDVHPFDPDRFFVADRELDYALVAVAAPPEVLAGYGFCPLTAAQGTVIIGECVTIVQHPRGEKKQIALRENRIIDIPEQVVHYAADTEPGSSGSPVFNDQWEVVALHHASVPTPHHAPEYSVLNEGIRISRVLAHLAAAELTADQRELLDELSRPPRTAVRAPVQAVPDAPRPATGPPESTAPSGPVPARAPEPTATGLQGVSAGGRSPRPPAAHSGPTAPSATVPVTTGPAATAVTTDGTVVVDVPVRLHLEISVTTTRADAPAAPTAPQAVGGRVYVEAPADTGTEAISIDPDYDARGGYGADFLGVHLPLPGVASFGDLASQELRYHHFSVVMHRARRLALFAAVNVDGAETVPLRRESDRWIVDPRLPREEQTGEDVYYDNDLDRGHLVRRLDPAWGPRAKEANDDTFHFTNCAPQHHSFNAGRSLWLGLEDHVLRSADTHDLSVSVVSGPVLADDDPEYRGVALPRQFFKLIAMVTTAGSLSVTGYLLSQEALLDEFRTGAEEFSFGAYRTFQVPVRRIADLTGLDLSAWAPGDPLARLESAVLPREVLRPADIILT